MEILILTSKNLNVQTFDATSIKFDDIVFGEVELLDLTKNYIYHPKNNSEIIIKKENDEMLTLQPQNAVIDIKDNKVIINY